MMRKRFLKPDLRPGPVPEPAARHGAGGRWDTVYVGGVELTGNTSAPAYANTDGIGNVSTTSATADNYNIKWDGSTLTLKNGLYYKCGTRETAIFTLSRVRQSAWPIRAGMRS